MRQQLETKWNEITHGWREILKISSFPNSNTIKITFSQSITAKKCTERGFLVFNMTVSNYDIKQELYIPVRCCMKCFTLEDHATRDCKKGSEYKLCSECAQESHVWHQCKEQNKRCVNCNENQSTMAMRCIKKKEIIRKKRLKESKKKNFSYPGGVMSNTSQPTLPLQQTNAKYASLITREDTLLIEICLGHARMRNVTWMFLVHMEWS